MVIAASHACGVSTPTVADLALTDASIDGGVICENPAFPQRANDVGYRVIVQTGNGGEVASPDPGTDWMLKSWSTFNHWVAQASYYWANRDGTNYSQTGALIDVKPGEKLSTQIAYDATSGHITAKISAPAGTSTIVIAAPFPNEKPLLFSSWKDFFTKAKVASTQILGSPVINVETHYVDQATLCPMLPFKITAASVPGASTAGAYASSSYGGLSCSEALAILNF